MTEQYCLLILLLLPKYPQYYIEVCYEKVLTPLGQTIKAREIITIYFS